MHLFLFVVFFFFLYYKTRHQTWTTWGIPRAFDGIGNTAWRLITRFGNNCGTKSIQHATTGVLQSWKGNGFQKDRIVSERGKAVRVRLLVNVSSTDMGGVTSLRFIHRMCNAHWQRLPDVFYSLERALKGRQLFCGSHLLETFNATIQWWKMETIGRTEKFNQMITDYRNSRWKTRDFFKIRGSTSTVFRPYSRPKLVEHL